MVLTDEALEPLVVATPSFSRRWAEYRASRRYDPRALEGAAMELAFHLAELAAQGQTEELRTVFEAMESLYLTRDELEPILTVSLLETFLHGAVQRRLDLAALYRLVAGRECRLAWAAAYEYNNGGKAWTGLTPAEAADLARRRAGP
jgi:hypothetical protein